MEINPRKTALIAIHCQGDIIGETGAQAPFFYEQVRQRRIVDQVRALMDQARTNGATVIYTRVAFKPDYSDLNANSPLLQAVAQAGCLVDGSPLADIVPELAPQEGDSVITHTRVGGFTPELAAILEERNVDTVVFCGVATNVSLESTARVATDRGYHVVVVEDACSAATLQAHQASIESLRLLGEIANISELEWIPAEDEANLSA
jgi:nicotinamidase-related amidase